MKTLILLIVFVGFFSHAQSPCQEDFQKFCPGLKEGMTGRAKCLAQYHSELSPGCKLLREEYRRNMQRVPPSCKIDIDRYCLDVMPGKGRLRECMENNTDKFSETCRKDFLADINPAGVKPAQKKVTPDPKEADKKAPEEVKAPKEKEPLAPQQKEVSPKKP